MKTFDQISKAVGHVYSSGAFPVVLGGDHSIGYPTVRGVSEHLSGNLGIIHFDRHVDTQETDLDERMHTTPWFHATDIPNVPARNLVQIGIGGWQAPRPGVKIGRERGTTIMTVTDCVEMGIEAAAQRALDRRSRRRLPAEHLGPRHRAVRQGEHQDVLARRPQPGRGHIAAHRVLRLLQGQGGRLSLALRRACRYAAACDGRHAAGWGCASRAACAADVRLLLHLRHWRARGVERFSDRPVRMGVEIRVWPAGAQARRGGCEAGLCHGV